MAAVAGDQYFCNDDFVCVKGHHPSKAKFDTKAECKTHCDAMYLKFGASLFNKKKLKHAEEEDPNNTVVGDNAQFDQFWAEMKQNQGTRRRTKRRTGKKEKKRTKSRVTRRTMKW